MASVEASPLIRTALFPGRGFGALLFDMDGTLLTSIEASERAWTRWATPFGLDAASFLPQSHGMRVAEVVAGLALPGVDPAEAAETILRWELADMDGVRELAGAGAFLAALPAGRWAVVTSAPRVLAQRRLAAAGLPPPPVLIAAEDIARGKPDPACYRLAASRLGVDPRDCLVFEDAPMGIQAGEAAGSQVLVITAAHRRPMPTRHPTMADYRDLAVTCDRACRMLSIARIG